MIPPPGFVKPIWRGWEQSVVNTNLAVAVTTIERSLGGCHKAKVIREPVHCPSSSNVHHYVRQVPHRCEVLPITPQKKGNGISHIYLPKIYFFQNISFRNSTFWGDESWDVNGVCCQDQQIFLSEGWWFCLCTNFTKSYRPNNVLHDVCHQRPMPR